MPKILVVDDSETVRDHLRTALEAGGFQVVVAVDGSDGLEKAKANKDVRLVICDVNMPKMDGLTMCKHLRDDPALKALPVFMLTTETNEEMKVKGKAVGVMAWMVKPFNAERMLAGIKKVLGT